MKKKSFEQSITALEALVQELEQGDLSLEKGLAAFEEGIKLARACQTQLDAAESRIETLMTPAAGPASADSADG